MTRDPFRRPPMIEVSDAAREFFRHPIRTLDRWAAEPWTCPECGCGAEWRTGCNCSNYGCGCAGSTAGPDTDYDDTFHRPANPEPVQPARGKWYLRGRCSLACGDVNCPPCIRQQLSEAESVTEPPFSWMTGRTDAPATEPAPPAEDFAAQAERRTAAEAAQAPPPTYTPVSETDAELAQVQRAQNQALFLRRTAVTEQEYREATQAQEHADDMTAAYGHRRRAAETQPPEPPVGTVLETRGVVDDEPLRIERTNQGWQQQYRDGEDEYGWRLHPTAISWRAAWSAWGPPNGADPFQEVADPDVPLPPWQPEPDDGLHTPDASDGRFDDGGGLPPAAEPCRSRSAASETQRARWHNRADVQVIDPPTPCTAQPTAAPTTRPAGGTGMTTVADARATIMGGHADLESARAGLAQARGDIEAAQAALRHGTEGSNQAEADQAHAQLAEAINKVDEALWQVGAALAEFEGVGQRL